MQILLIIFNFETWWILNQCLKGAQLLFSVLSFLVAYCHFTFNLKNELLALDCFKSITNNEK